MAHSRNKGAHGEREVAAELFAELGIKFERDLEQYRKDDRGDLLAIDCPDFPFTIEVKRYEKGWTCKPAWESQVFKAAKAANKHPCVAYRYNGQKWRYRIWIDALAEAMGTDRVSGLYFETDAQGFAYVAREIMARKAFDRRWMIK